MILNIQIAAVGIVVVLGFFFLWKMIARLEHKLDRMAAAAREPLMAAPMGGESPIDIDMAAAEAFMNQVFNTPDCTADTGVVIEEIPQAVAQQAPAEAAPSEAESAKAGAKGLNKMNVEGLRELCRERGLPEEGTRKELIARLQ